MSDRAELCERLAGVLDAEEDLYRELHAVLQREREVIVALDADALSAVVQRKEALAEEGRLLEESRSEVAHRLAVTMNCADPMPSLSVLCTKLGPEAGRLSTAQRRLVALVAATRELLDANASFANASLSQVRATLKMLGRLVPLDSGYGPTGLRESSELASGRLIRRSA